MTETLSWRRIVSRDSWLDDLDTQSREADESFTDTNEATARWTEEERPAEMVEDLPRGLVDAYIERAMKHVYAREIEPGTWFATVAGLDGAWGDGVTRAVAESELRDALAGWVGVKRRLRQDIPAFEGLDLNLRQSDPGPA